MNAREARELEMAQSTVLFAFYGDQGSTVWQLYWTGDENRFISVTPVSAQKILLFFLPYKDVEAIAGDLEEIYKTYMVPTLGLRLARLWYWKEVIGTVGPFFWRRISIMAILVTAWKLLRHLRH